MYKILISLIFMARFLNACESNDTLIVWHVLDGELGKIFNELLLDFEKQEPRIKVQAMHKGNYDKTLDAFLNDPQDPDIV